MRRKLLSGSLALSAAACSPPAPPKTSVPSPPVASAIQPSPSPPGRANAADGGDLWTYLPGATGSFATYGPAGGPPAFTIACRPGEGRVALTRSGGQGSTMTVTTSSGLASWPAGIENGGTTVLLAARDPFLDKLAFSRGRFTVATPGTRDLVIPAWAEPARVIEDCRG